MQYHESQPTRQSESFEILGGVLKSWHGQEISSASPHEVEVVEVTRDLQIRPGVPIHVLATSLLLVALRVWIGSERMDQLDCDLLGQDQPMGVVAEVLDVLSTLDVPTFIPEPVDDQRHEVVARFQVSREVVVARDGVGRDAWLLRVILDEVPRLSQVAVDLDVVVVTAIHVTAVKVVAGVKDLLDSPGRERVVRQLNQVKPLGVGTQVRVTDHSQTTLQRHEPGEVGLEVVVRRGVRQVERPVELGKDQVRLGFAQGGDRDFHFLRFGVQPSADVLELEASPLQECQHPIFEHDHVCSCH